MRKLPIGLSLVALASLIGFGLWANYRLNTLLDEIDWDNIPL